MYDNIPDMVQALYEGSADAMLMNVAYVDVVEAQDGYETFSSRTRTLYDHEEENVVTEDSQTAEKSITTDPFVVYISGSDTRNLTLTTSRSDVNILAVVNPSTKQVLLINTPRDYYVDTAASAGAKDKLTHCGMYGIDCSMATLGNLYDEHVDYYVQINFNGFANFMQGRYGTDKLNNALWVLLLILWFVNIFVWNRVARYIIDGIMLLIIVLICFRMFSRNIVARSAENRKFLPIYNAVTGWFRLTFKKIRDRKDYRYIKCPVCKAQLRVRNKKGNHTVRCPKCGSEFNKKI